MKFTWFQGCCKKVFGVEVSKCVESISGVFQDSLKGVSGEFLRVCEASSKGVSKQFQGSFWRVSRKLPGVS